MNWDKDDNDKDDEDDDADDDDNDDDDDDAEAGELAYPDHAPDVGRGQPALLVVVGPAQLPAVLLQHSSKRWSRFLRLFPDLGTYGIF